MDFKKLIFILFLGLCAVGMACHCLRAPVASTKAIVHRATSPSQKALYDLDAETNVNDVQAYTKEDVMKKKVSK